MYVMTPEYGAATQLEKIDMLDFADLVAVNKFHPGEIVQMPLLTGSQERSEYAPLPLFRFLVPKSCEYP